MHDSTTVLISSLLLCVVVAATCDVHSSSLFIPVLQAGAAVPTLAPDCDGCERQYCACLSQDLNVTIVNASNSGLPGSFCSGESSGCTLDCASRYISCKVELNDQLRAASATGACGNWSAMFHLQQLAAAAAENFTTTLLFSTCAATVCEIQNSSGSVCPELPSSDSCNASALGVIAPTTLSPTPAQTPVPDPPNFPSNALLVSVNATAMVSNLGGSNGNESVAETVSQLSLRTVLADALQAALGFHTAFHHQSSLLDEAALRSAIRNGVFSISTGVSFFVEVNLTLTVQNSSGSPWTGAIFLLSVLESNSSGSLLPSDRGARQLFDWASRRSSRPRLFDHLAVFSASVTSQFPPFDSPPLPEATASWGSSSAELPSDVEDASGARLWVFLLALAGAAAVGALIGLLVAKFVISEPEVPSLRQRLLQEPVLEGDSHQDDNQLL